MRERLERERNFVVIGTVVGELCQYYEVADSLKSDMIDYGTKLLYWMIDDNQDGLRIVFTGTKRKGKDLFNHLKAMYPTTKLYCNGKLIK